MARRHGLHQFPGNGQALDARHVSPRSSAYPDQHEGSAGHSRRTLPQQASMPGMPGIRWSLNSTVAPASQGGADAGHSTQYRRSVHPGGNGTPQAVRRTGAVHQRVVVDQQDPAFGSVRPDADPGLVGASAGRSRQREPEVCRGARPAGQLEVAPDYTAALQPTIAEPGAAPSSLGSEAAVVMAQRASPSMPAPVADARRCEEAALAHGRGGSRSSPARMAMLLRRGSAAASVHHEVEQGEHQLAGSSPDVRQPRLDLGRQQQARPQRALQSRPRCLISASMPMRRAALVVLPRERQQALHQVRARSARLQPDRDDLLARRHRGPGRSARSPGAPITGAQQVVVVRDAAGQLGLRVPTSAPGRFFGSARRAVRGCAQRSSATRVPPARRSCAAAGVRSSGGLDLHRRGPVHTHQRRPPLPGADSSSIGP